MCLRCGNCCHVDVAAYVTIDDIKRWEKEGRSDILAHIRTYDITWNENRAINRFGENINNCRMSCIYLQWDGSKTNCQIYETRTDVCRNYVPGSTWLCPQYRKKLL
ncbi:MAG TPA: YkgJ family cysteine cluster protein [Syntrophorhabdaceae bacterium]|nr:YkgJ family cysteine cluster protein [Syntrophorhabdaceae bacterium]HQK46273.1 YkgJ family cysteine cluster protein [Syntrophorhabdaceae bacterium]